MVAVTGPTRKQRFHAALKLAGITQEQWRTEVYPVSRQHLLEVFAGTRVAGAALSSAIDAFIDEHLAGAA